MSAKQLTNEEILIVGVLNDCFLASEGNPLTTARLIIKVLKEEGYAIHKKRGKEKV